MSASSELLRALVTKRLAAAAQDIFVLFERTIAEYELELRRLRTQTHHQGSEESAGNKEEPHATGVQLVLLREDNPLPHVKEDPELSVKQEPLCVKTEDDKNELYHRPVQDLADIDRAVPQSPLTPCLPTQFPPMQSLPTQTPSIQSPPKRCLSTQSQSDSEELSSDEPPVGYTVGSKKFVVKPHRCPECGKRFLRKDHLQGHMIIHTGERPFRCSFCDKTFIRQNHLKTHLRNHTGERPYSCPFCGRGFTTKALLTPHLRIHTGERPHTCSHCSKGFIQRSHLRAHEKTHCRDKSFTCLICRQVFSERGELMVHSRLVHPE